MAAIDTGFVGESPGRETKPVVKNEPPRGGKEGKENWGAPLDLGGLEGESRNPN